MRAVNDLQHTGYSRPIYKPGRSAVVQKKTAEVKAKCQCHDKSLTDTV